MNKDFIIEVLEDAKSFYKDDELKAIEEAISIVRDQFKREKYMKSLLTGMRDVTPEERESANKYIESISINTGINIFDLIDENGIPVKNKNICKDYCKHYEPSDKWPCKDCNANFYDRLDELESLMNKRK